MVSNENWKYNLHAFCPLDCYCPVADQILYRNVSNDNILLFKLLVINHISWIATPLGLHFNISDKNCSHPEKNEILARAYAKCQTPGEDMVNKLLLVVSILFMGGVGATAAGAVT